MKSELHVLGALIVLIFCVLKMNRILFVRVLLVLTSINMDDERWDISCIFTTNSPSA